MDVDQWWNKPERDKQKDPEDTFLSTSFFHHKFHDDSSGIELGHRSERQSPELCGGYEKVQLQSTAYHLKGNSTARARYCYRKKNIK